MKRLLNIKAAAVYVALSPDEIRNRIAMQIFPFVNISKGRKPIFRFDIKELDRWIEALPGLKTEDLPDE